MNRVEIKVGGFPGRTLVISRVLNRRKVVDVHVIRHNDDPSWVLTGRPLDARRSLGEPVFLSSPELDVIITFIGLDITIGGLIRHGSDRPGPEHVLLTEEDLHVIMGNWLVVPGEVQIDIWDLVPLEP